MWSNCYGTTSRQGTFLSFLHVSDCCWLFDEELKTTDEAGRFDDESLCYTRVAPVARHLAA
jgi:hypothetical protein